MSSKLFVDPLAGNVGIGTTVPTQKLHVAGNMVVGTNAGYLNKLVPAVDGKINGVNITALNARTRASRASAEAAVSTWTTRGLLVGPSKNWVAIVWAPELSLFVAVAYGGTGNRVMTSPDGIVWTARISAVDNNWFSITWAPELSIFVSVAWTGTGNRVMTSPDGITWTARESPVDNGWNAVKWVPELAIFVAVANTGTDDRVMTSSNGINWILRATPVTDGGWVSITWSPELSLLVAVGDRGNSIRTMTSPDGITWTARTSAAVNNWRSVTWSPELSIFVAVATSGIGNRVMTSTDGIFWTARTSADDSSWQSVTWAPELSIFVATASTGDSRIMTSFDGVTWTSRTSAANTRWLGVTWAAELSIFVAVTDNGSANNCVMTSAICMPNAKNVVKALPSQMTVLPNGNVGVGTTNPTTKLQIYGTVQMNDFSSTVQAFPPGPMTSYTTNLSSSYGSGPYVASASSEYFNASYVWLCFTKTYAPSESLWQTGAWSTTSPYGPTTATVTLDVNNAQYAGEWIQIQMPCSIILSSYDVVSSTYNASNQSPATFWILGSVNGTQWVLLDSKAEITDWVNSTLKSFSVTTTQAYSYFRFVINKLNGNTGYGQVAEWILNGRQDIINSFSGGNAIINGSISAGNLGMFRNRIINGNFEIWQRGNTLTSTSSGGFIADRWKYGYNGTGATRIFSKQAFTMGQSEVPGNPKNYLRWNQSVAGSGATGNNIGQSIENVETFAGKTCTVSFYAKANVTTQSLSFNLSQVFGTGGSPSTGVSSFTAGIPLTTSWEKITFNVNVPSIAGKTKGTNNDDYIILQMTPNPLNATFIIDIAQVQIEEGNIATPFEFRPFAIEIKLCERFYEKSFEVGVVPSFITNALVIGSISYPTFYTASSYSTAFTLFYKTTKRAIGTPVIYGNSSTYSVAKHQFGVGYTNVGLNAQYAMSTNQYTFEVVVPVSTNSIAFGYTIECEI
jgi:hypothetical protein